MYVHMHVTSSKIEAHVKLNVFLVRDFVLTPTHFRFATLVLFESDSGNRVAVAEPNGILSTLTALNNLRV